MSESKVDEVLEIEVKSDASSQEVKEVFEFAEMLESQGYRVVTDIEEATA